MESSGRIHLKIRAMNRIKESFGPRLWLKWLKHDRIPFVTYANGRRGQMKTFRQTDGLILALVNNNCSFHIYGLRLMVRRLTLLYHAARAAPTTEYTTEYAGTAGS